MNRLSQFLYPLVLFAFTLFSYLFIDANFFPLQGLYTGFSENNRKLITIMYVLFVCFMYLFYVLFLSFIQKKVISFKQVLLLIILAFFMLILSYPAILSFDIFNYLASAKTIFLYKENPYISMPIDFHGDSILQFTRAANKTALYGPVWIFLSGIPYLLGFGNILFVLFNLKLFIACFYFGTLVLIWFLSKKNLYSFAFFALNPLVLIETFVSGHNDIVMMFFALLSLFLFKKRYYLLFGFIFLLSVLIKYATLFLLPIFFYLVWKRYRKREINWENVFLICSLIMFIVFLLSFLREEIYSWYAIWFLSFAPFLRRRTMLFYVFLSFSYSLLLGYIPFMVLGTYSDPTPIIKTTVVFGVPFCVLIFLFFLRKRHV